MDFSLPADNSRRRRRLKKPGALAPGFTGVGRSQLPASTSRYIPGHCQVCYGMCNNSYDMLAPIECPYHPERYT